MFKLAWRNLVHERTRLLISSGGVALAIVLILVMRGVFAGSEEHAVAYIKRQPASLWLMQAGVSNLHMASSLLPPQIVEKVKSVEGVKDAVGVLYANAGVDVDGNLVYSYIFAVDNQAPFGGPWDLEAGTDDLEFDEVVLDRNLAARYGVDLGDRVSILGNELTIAGLSNGTFGIATNITFVNKSALAMLMGVPVESASYILVQPENGTEIDRLSERLRAEIPDANLLTQVEFANSDKELIRQMGVDIIRAMNIVSYIVGLLVIGLTIYTATLERAREYGILKAIGASSHNLVSVVFIQAFLSTALGFSFGIVLSFGVADLVIRLFPEMAIIIEWDYLLQQVPVLAAVTGAAALFPLSRILRLDPAIAFKS